MTLRHTVLGLLLVSLLQVVVLAGEYLGAVYPHWSETTVKLKTIPVDPRSLFRGNYASLNYDISTLPVTLYKGPQQLRENERVYVLLELDEDGISTARQVLLRPPAQGLFIRGRIKNRRWGNKDNLSIKYGIEAWFAPKREALALEKRLRSGALAEVSLATNGKAALKAVIAD